MFNLNNNMINMNVFVYSKIKQFMIDSEGLDKIEIKKKNEKLLSKKTSETSFD